MFERGGGSCLRVKGAESGAPQLPVLAKNGTGTARTGEAIQLTSNPVSPCGVVEGPTIGIARDASGIVITFKSGTLVSSANVGGPYNPIAGATSPYKVTATGAAQFFQVRTL